MDSGIDKLSQKTADKLPVKAFGIDDAMMIFSIIKLAFQAFQSCSDAATAKSEVAEASNGDGTYNRPTVRKAARRVRIASRHKGQHLSKSQAEELATKMLSTVEEEDHEVIAACFAEPMDELAAKVNAEASELD